MQIITHQIRHPNWFHFLLHFNEEEKNRKMEKTLDIEHHMQCLWILLCLDRVYNVHYIAIEIGMNLISDIVTNSHPIHLYTKSHHQIYYNSHKAPNQFDQN